MELNLNSLTVDSNGRVSFSGLSSGIDFRGVVESTRVADNQDKITALEDLRANLEGLKQSLSKLRGAVSFGSVEDIFASKQAFATTSRLDGTVASAAGNLIGVTVTNAAAAGTHTIEVLQTAAAHKVSGDKVTSLTAALASVSAGDAFIVNGGKTYQSAQQASGTTQIGSSGTLNFTRISDSGALGSIVYNATDTLQDLATNITNNITGATATVVTSGAGVRLEITATDAMNIAETGAGTAITDLQIADKNRIALTGGESLIDLRDRINTANTGVTASIASVSSTEHYLLLTKDVTGEAMVLTDDAGNALESLGVLTGGAIKNELQAAQTARFYVDGLLDQTNTIYESSFQTSATVQAGSAGTIQFTRDSDSFNLGSIAYGATDTLQDIATNITTNITDVTATVVADGGGFRLEISGTNGFSMAETGAGSALTDLGIDNKRLALIRDTNTVDDVFDGVTLSLFQAEQGTTIKVEIERDLSTVKTEIFNFVDAYNTLKTFVNEHRQFDSTTGQESDESGSLFSSNALREVDSALALIVGNGVGGVDLNYSVLAQIGIDFVDNNNLNNPLLKNTLEVDETQLDAALLNNANDVERLFAFDFTPSDSRFTLLGYNRNTTYSNTGYTLNLHNPVAGSNLVQYSEQADNPYWIALRSSINADSGTVAAPDGSFTADALVADATLNSHGQVGVVSVTAGETYVYSTYAKKGAVDAMRLNLAGANFDVDTYADFDLNSGTVLFTGGNAEAANIEDVGNGWYRISVQGTAIGTGSGSFERHTVDPNHPNYVATRAISFSGDGTSEYTYLWGAQVETVTATAPPSPYVATTTTADPTSANIDGNSDGSDDGSATVASQIVTVNTGGAQGLRMLYSGITLDTTVQIDFTLGVGAQMFNKIEALLDSTTGVVETEIDNLTDSNELAQSRIDEMLVRLEIQERDLLDRFLRMETALATANRILESIRQTTEAMFGNGN
jgi:flagellar capping protein FliD